MISRNKISGFVYSLEDASHTGQMHPKQAITVCSRMCSAFGSAGLGWLNQPHELPLLPLLCCSCACCTASQSACVMSHARCASFWALQPQQSRLQADAEPRPGVCRSTLGYQQVSTSLGLTR